MANDTSARAVRKAEPLTDEEWMSVTQAARTLDCAPQTIYNRALRGELETTRFVGRVFVSRASVERALAAQTA